MMFETPDDVLEHFGVKGQKWGVRNKRSSNSGGMSKKKKVLIGAGVVGGAALAAVIIRNHGSIRSGALTARKAAPQVLAGRNAAKTIAARHRVTRPATGDIARMKSQIAASIRDANSELRSRDNALNIPIHARTYLPEWE